MIEREEGLERRRELFGFVPRGKQNRHRRTISILEGRDASELGHPRKAPGNIDRLKNPERSNEPEESSPEQVQRPISSTRNRSNKLCYHAGWPRLFRSSVQDA